MQDLSSTVCINCGHAVQPWFYSSSGFVACENCDVVSRSPMPTPEELERIYSTHYSDEKVKTQNTGMASPPEAIVGIARCVLSRAVNGEQRFLDYGASVGDLAHLFSVAGKEAWGVEFSDSARKAAAENHGFRFQKDLSGVPKAFFDWVTVVEVIEHLVRPKEVLRELFAVLKPGGALFVSTPNRNSLTAKIEKQNWREALKPFHLVLFSQNALETMLRESGFVEIEFLRFSPLTTGSLPKRMMHRVLQFFGLYGGLRVIARKPLG